MTPARWRQISLVLYEALQREKHERAAFLTAACAGDPALRQEIDSLLEHEDSASHFLSHPPIEVPQTAATTDDGRGSGLFQPGERVADRFKIIRLIGRGGMGVVYEAEDLELGGHVAIKTIRPEAARDPRAAERFRQEVYLARKVTHPHVCRIFDLYHHGVGSQRSEVTFVSMELLPGETLAERLRRTGRMLPAEALPLVSQMASGLAAAHDAGIIHRDLKPGNIVLVPVRGNTGGVRAVVTDFGLARVNASDASMALSVTGVGEIVGTPEYMAPEQLTGGEITAATDLYALGVVMFEMVTGRLPFRGDSPLATAMKRLDEPPPSPRALVPDLEAHWETSILKCLERRPTDRLSSARALTALLGGDAGAASASRRKRALTAGVLITVVAAIIAGLVAGLPPSRAPREPAVDSASSSAAAPRRAVAVLGFKSLTGRPETAWLSTAFAELLTTELSARGRLRTIAGEDVSRMKGDLRMQDAETFARDTLALIRLHLGSDVVVLGSYLALGDRVRLDVRVQDTRQGETIATLSETGSEAELLDMVARVGATLRKAMGLEALSESEAGSIRASMPANAEAARLYAEGLQKLRLYDALGARPLLERAAAADPASALIQAALAQSWSSLGYGSRARDAARKAVELSSSLNRDDQRLIEARYRLASNEFAIAADVYRGLFAQYPDNIDYGLGLAQAEVSAGRARDALSTLDQLRRLPSPLGDDPRIDLATASALRPLGEWKRILESAQRAVAKGRALGAPSLIARARLSESGAWSDLGDAAKAREAVDEARRLYAERGDRWGVARSDNVIGILLAQEGRPDEARRMYDRALETYRAIGDQQGIAIELNNIALLLNRAGKSNDAIRLHEQAIKINAEIGDRRAVAMALANIGVIFRQRGELTEALRRYEEALAVRRELGDRAGTARLLSNIGVALHEQGDLAGGRQRYEEALATWREVGDKAGAGLALSNLATALRQQGELARSRAAHEESLALRREAGDKDDVAMGVVDLGDLHFDAGDLRAARSAYEEGLGLATAGGQKRIIAYAQHGLGQVALVEQRIADAGSLLNQALRLRESIGEQTTSAETRLSLAALEIANGRPDRSEVHAASAVSVFAAKKMRDMHARALAELAVARLANANVKGAENAAQQAQTLAASTQNPFIRLTVQLSMARADLEANRTSVASTSFERVRSEAARIGLVGLELESRLEQARVALRAGDVEPGRSALARLEADAQARGFALVARRAAAARR
jgi:eukaryotic-like serine/threonine-protein kinase